MRSRPPRNRRAKALGQSMVEFALVAPILFLLIGAAVDLGRLFYSYVAVENAAKEGALVGARSPLCDDQGLTICANPNNVVWHVNHEAPNLTDGSGNSLMSSTVACRKPDGTLVQSITDCLDGDTYQVTVSMPFRMVTPLISSLVPSSFTLTKEAQATVMSDAFDPSGLEVLIWASTGNSLNPSEITSACTQADSVQAPGFYYQPCQDSLNTDHYLQFNENSTVSYEVRVRNTGNIQLTNITYAFSENGLSFSTPSNCSSLPNTLAANSAPVYCSFSRTAVVTNVAGGANDDLVSIKTSAKANGLSAGTNATSTDVKVMPAPRLAVNLLASPWKLGGTAGNGSNGTPSFPLGNLSLNRDTTSSAPEIQNPTGWLYVSIQNQGGTANNFTLTVTRAGTPISLASCTVPVPNSLPATGQPGNTWTCTLPQSFTTTGPFAFSATATATNAQYVSSQPNVTVTTATCTTSGYKVVPNLVDTLTPTADGSLKTVTQAQAVWTAAGFTGALTTNPAGALGSTTVSQQTQPAYACMAPSTAVTVTAP